MDVGLRGIIILNEGLRYSLIPTITPLCIENAQSYYGVVTFRSQNAHKMGVLIVQRCKKSYI